MKILVVMQYWDGDKAQAEEVVSLASDLLPEMSDLVDLAFVYRHDAKPPRGAIQIKAGLKFGKVHAWKSSRSGTGWPEGSNAIAYGVLNDVPIRRHLYKEFEDIDAILLLEADTVFTRPNWDKELAALWDKTVKAQKYVTGALVGEYGGPEPHINGVALFAWNASTVIPELRGGTCLEGWDYTHRKAILAKAMPSGLFRLDYKRPMITPDLLFAERDGIAPLVYHGVKDDSAIKAVREKYGLGVTPKEPNLVA